MDCRSHIYLFDDQKSEELSSSSFFDQCGKDEAFSRIFCQRAYLEIRSQLENNGHHERLGRFSSFQDLVSLNSNHQMLPSLKPALICAFQLGKFIREAGETNHLYSSKSDKYLLGFGTGSLTASAISCASNIHDLLPLAITTIGVATNLGIKLCETARSIGLSSGNYTKPWSLVVSDISFAEAVAALKDFMVENRFPPLSRPAISEVSETSIGFTGPPASLEALKNSQFNGRKTWSSPVYVPCHNSTIFGQIDIDEILNFGLPGTLNDRHSLVPVVSGGTGTLATGKNFAQLVQNALQDILCIPINRPDVYHGIAYVSGFNKNIEIIIHSNTVSSQADTALIQALRSRGYTVGTSVEQVPTLKSRAQTGFKPKLAIVGMSGRFPEAEDPNAFWDLLSRGLDVHKTVPETRWDVKTHVDVTLRKKNTSGASFGCWLNNPGYFDRKFFNMSPRETPQVDPASRLALMTAYEAMEEAGMVPGSTPSTSRDRVGVFYGVTSNDWMENNSSQNIDTYFIAGGCRAFIPGRINFFFKLSGPSLSIDTACSSSLAAVHAACNSIWQGDCDTAIAGGTNILTNPDYTAGLDRGHFLSRSGNCRSFDDEADGYCRGEGVVTVIIKSLEDAIAEKDPILAVIAGASTNHSAEAVSITRPHVGSQQAIFKKILNDANVNANDISYVEMHGTGTQAGDVAEMESVLETFSPLNSLQARKRDQTLHLGSVKANIGHGEGVAGVTSLAKILLMLKFNVIPPHCGIKTKINQKFPTNLAERNVQIAKVQHPWPKSQNSIRRAFINNFSAAGGNSALLIEDGPLTQEERMADSRTSYVVTTSAKTLTSLRNNLQSLLRFCESNRNINLPQLSYTTTARRAHFSHRAVMVGCDLEQILFEAHQALDNPRTLSPSKIATGLTFAFAGNGTQYLGMGQKLFLTLPSFREEMLRLDRLVQHQGFPTMIEVITSDNEMSNGESPTILQLATVCLEIALARLWISWGIKPRLVVGHSLGEYAALCIAGVLSDSDTIYVVGKRAQLLEQRCKQGTRAMLYVGATVATVRYHLRNIEFEVSCINAPKNTVISASLEMIAKAQSIFASVKHPSINCTVLACPYAFHSAQVDPILQELESVARNINFQKPEIPVLSPSLCRIVDEDGVFGPIYLSDHCRNPVNMLEGLKVAKQVGAIRDRGIVVDIGPHPTFYGMMEPTLESEIVVLPTLSRDQDPWQVLNATIARLYLEGSDINWKAFQTGFEASHKVLDLPRYSWDLDNYWIQYVNDWSLRKGDPLPNQNQSFFSSQLAKPKIPIPKIVPFPKTSSVHRLLQDSIIDGKICVSSESDLSHPELMSLAQGHKVNHIPLVTPSIYADIAFTLITYVIERYLPQKMGSRLEIADLTIEKALVTEETGKPQLLVANVTMDKKSQATIVGYSNGKSKQHAVQYAHCKIQIHQCSIRKLPPHMGVRSIVDRIAQFRESLNTGTTFRYNSSMIYRMVATIAQFDPDLYQAVTEIILDNTAMEASSIISFWKVKLQAGQTFHTHPAYIDALTQSAGFVMNANDKSNLDIDVFVNHGWKSFQLFEKLENSGTYETLVKMKEGPGKLWEGDLVVLRDERIVASFKGIILQGVPKRVLCYILTKEKEKMTSSSLEDQSEGIRIASKEHCTPTELQLDQPLVLVPTHIPNDPPKFQQNSLKPDLVARAMKIVAEESGLPVHELADSCHLMNVGIDSLLALQILSRFRHDLSLDMDSADFHSLDTVKSLKEFINSSYLAASARISIKEGEVQKDRSSEIVLMPDAASKEVAMDQELVHQSLRIISEEVGVPMDELTDDVVFDDIGIDSNISLMISARFRKELSLGGTNNILWNNSNLKELKTTLGAIRNQLALPKLPRNVADEKLTPTLTTAFVDKYSAHLSKSPSTNNPRGQPESIRIQNPMLRATSVLLYGRPQSAAKTLILFPDGSGSATSYINVPSVRESLCIIALNCPYLHSPENMTCTLDELMDYYIVEIRRRQPTGPYHFGGWSCGGVLAYRATQLFIQEGEVVETLSLIDAPAPNGLDPLPDRWYEHCSRHGVFRELFSGELSSVPESQSIPDWLIPHFHANVNILKDYHAEALPAGFAPRTSILWASDCVTGGGKFPVFTESPSDPEGIKFLTEKRVDFSAGDWGCLFPGGKIEVVVLSGANHFSMMGRANSAFMRDFLDCATR